MKELKIRTVGYAENPPVPLPKVANVYQTRDYSLFTTFSSNREPDHVDRIMSNILDKGYVSNPIITSIDAMTGKYIIIDGNNRFHALKSLELPITFVILDNATENDMVALNIVNKNWSKIDFIKFYASKGIEDYKIYLDFLKKYPDFKVMTMEYVLRLSCTNDETMKKSKSTHHSLTRGIFKVKDAEASRRLLDFLLRVKQIQTPDVVYNQNHFVQAVIKIRRLSVFEPNEMLAKIEKYKSLVIRQVNVASYISMLETIYNKNRKDGKIHFDI